MKNDEIVQIAVQLNTEEAQIDLSALTNTLSVLSESMDVVCQWDMSGLVADLQKLTKSIENLNGQLAASVESRDISGVIAEITTTLSSLASIDGGKLIKKALESVEDMLLTMYINFDDFIGALGGMGETLGAIFAGTAGTVIIAVIAILAAIVGIVAVSEYMSDGVLINLEGLKQHFEEFKESVAGLWQSLCDDIITPISENIGATMEWLWTDYLEPMWNRIDQFLTSVGEQLHTLWDVSLRPLIEFISVVFGPVIISVVKIVVDAVGALLAFVGEVISGLMDALDGVVQYWTGVFTGDFEMVLNGLAKYIVGALEIIGGFLKLVGNAFIWLLNTIWSLLCSVVGGVVNIVGGIVSFVGELTGNNWGFQLPIKPYQIPYLAQGAVLPANKPFLAMVGDQKHGTNVEAPLATIQEAVALVMEDMVASNMAGQYVVGFLKRCFETGFQKADNLRPVGVIGEGLARRRRPEGTGENGKEEIPMKK